MTEDRLPADRSRAEPPRRSDAGDLRIELLPRAPYEAAYVPECAIVGFAFEPQKGDHAFASDRRERYSARANGLAYTPAGCSVYSRSERGGEYLRIRPLGDAVAPGAASRRFSDAIDPQAIAAAHGLRRLLLQEEGADPLECEALAIALLERACALSRGRDAPRAQGLTGYRLRRLEETIEARLGQKISIADLARETGMSAGHFTRSFRAATGRSPQDYIIDRRLAEARRLIATTGEAIGAIAHRTGFPSHAHMAAQFRDRLGVVPGRFRATRAGGAAD